MANRTVKDAHTVHGTNPQYLVEKIIRSRIYESRYWKEECFAVNEELLVERAAALKYVGGVYGGNIKPTPFLCLALKMLQIQPAKDIVIEFIRQQDYKYARALGIFYLRLTHDSLECYRYLEPLFNDYRKLKRIDRQGAFTVVHMDEFVDELLREERACDVILPRLQRRHVLEEEGDLEARASLLDEELQDVRLSDAEADAAAAAGEDDDDDDSGGSSAPASPRPAVASASAGQHSRRHHHQQRRSSRSRSRSPPPQRDRLHRRSRSRSRSRSPVERHRKTGDSGGGGEPKKKRKKDKDRREKDKADPRDRPDKAKAKDKDKEGRRDRDRHADRSQHDRKRSSKADGDDGGRRDRDRGGRGRGGGEEDAEIREANKLRAELGIPLLKP